MNLYDLYYMAIKVLAKEGGFFDLRWNISSFLTLINGRRNVDEPNSAIQKRTKRQKSNMRNEICQQRDIILPDTSGKDENINKHEINSMNIHELRDGLSNQKLKKTTFLLWR